LQLNTTLTIRRTGLCWTIAFACLGVLARGSGESSPSADKLISPDGKLMAIITPGRQKSESRIEVCHRGGTLLRSHDFSSVDGERGYFVDGAKWTPDSHFLVVRMRSSGGHSPMYAPIVFWSRERNVFYHLTNFTGDQQFNVSAPNKVSVRTWPGLKLATSSLAKLSPSQVTELK
jgi:hypothetical protein